MLLHSIVEIDEELLLAVVLFNALQSAGFSVSDNTEAERESKSVGNEGLCMCLDTRKISYIHPPLCLFFLSLRYDRCICMKVAFYFVSEI